MTSRSERVLVTGARGFTGRYLADRLRADGYDVVGMTEALPAGASEVHANLLDPEATARAVELVRPDRVVHLAALSFIPHDDVEAIYRVNLLGSLALLQALDTRSTPIHSVILASSAAVYGNAGADAIEETVAPAPVSHYGASKLAMEHMAATFRDRLPIVVVRPFNYTGPGQAEHFAVPKLVSHFRRRVETIDLGNIDVVREFMDVRNVVEIYRRLLACPAASGETVNVCTGRGVSLREVIAALEAQTGHHAAIRVDPRLVRAHDVPRVVGSPRKLEGLIGSLPEITLAATLREMLASGTER
jgi:nucleoside-diphosphate-sugar epimerase